LCVVRFSIFTYCSRRLHNCANSSIDSWGNGLGTRILLLCCIFYTKESI